jgi:hypothetical protein
VLRLPKENDSDLKYSAIVSLDPAGVKDSGVAVRLTSSLRNVSLSRLRFPDFTYQGWIFEPGFHDDLTEYLARNTGKDQKVLLVVENSAYRSFTIARSIGRAIGCLEGNLHYCNMGDASKTEYLAPKTWRRLSMPGVQVSGRDEWKRAAVDIVAKRYGEVVGSDLAEAVLINDAAVMSPKMWSVKKRKAGNK